MYNTAQLCAGARDRSSAPTDAITVYPWWCMRVSTGESREGETVDDEQTHLLADIRQLSLALESAVSGYSRVACKPEPELLQHLEQLHHVVHAEDGDEIEGQVQVLLHLRAVGVVGDETAVKLLDARRARSTRRCPRTRPCVRAPRRRRRPRDTAESYPRARLTGEFGDLALAKTAAQEVVDAVAA